VLRDERLSDRHDNTDVSVELCLDELLGLAEEDREEDREEDLARSVVRAAKVAPLRVATAMVVDTMGGRNLAILSKKKVIVESPK
jgi:hypothetical protein